MELDEKLKTELAKFIEQLKINFKELSLNDINLLKSFLDKYIKENAKNITLQIAFYLELANTLTQLECQLCDNLTPSQHIIEKAIYYAELVLNNVIYIEDSKLAEIERLSKPNPYEDYF